MPQDAVENASLQGRLAGVEEQYRLLSECATDYALIMFDPDGRVVHWSPAAARLLGYWEGEILGSPVSRLFAPEDLSAGRLEEERKAAVASGRSIRERWVQRKDGTRRWCNVVTTALLERGRLRGFAQVIHDLTEQRRTEEALRDSQDRQRAISEAFSDYTCVARINFETGAVDVESGADAVTRITGYAPGELTVRWGLAYLLHPDDVLVGLQSVERLLTGESVSDEIRIIRKNGDVRWLRFVARAVPEGGNPHVLCIHASAQDVTQRKHAAEALEESERRFRQLAENINEVFWMSDLLRTQMLYVSPAYQTVWGRPCESLYQEPLSWLESIHPDDQQWVMTTLEQYARGEAVVVEYRIARPDGSLRWIRDRGFPVRDESGAVYRVAGIAEDVTERKQAEAALREADRRKDEFLALLGHELRNPLGPIRTAVGLLALRGDDPALVAQARDVIDRQATQMTRLVDELLDASRIVTGKIQLRRERLDLAALTRAVAEDHRAETETVGLALAVETPAAPVWIQGDAARMTQVVGNLLHNATKFTDPGGRVMVRLAEEGGQAALSVADTGVGIAPEALLRLFEVFSQADATLERSKGGLGLGLSVVKELVEQHDGWVRGASEGPGRGAVFTVWLPLDRTAPVASAPAPAAPAGSPRRSVRRKVLIIEDGRDTAESLRMFLVLKGFETAVAFTGPEGVEQARRFGPDAVVCDLGLPGMNGFEVARALRADPAMAGVLLLCVSGYGQEQDRRQAREAGFDAALVKPADPEHLVRLLTGS